VSNSVNLFELINVKQQCIS